MKKEFSTYLYSILAYIFIVVFLVIINWIFFQNFFITNQASLRGFFSLLPWFFLFFIPAIAMRTWSEEKRLGTIEVILTLPYPEWQVIFAKFLSGALFIVLILVFSLPLPISISTIGNLDTGQVIGQYVAAFFLGASIFALGQWLSSLTKNQIVSFIITVAVSFLLIVLGISFFVRSGSFLGNIFSGLSLLSHYESMSRGVLDLRDLVYFLSFIFLFLYLNAYTLQRRN